jgi:hypothetical protein
MNAKELEHKDLNRSRPKYLLVLLSLLSLFIGLGAWAFSSPVGSSPDDDFHLASIWCALGDRPGLCEPSELEGHKQIDAALNRSSCYAFESKLSASCQAESGLYGEPLFIDSTRGSFASNYPPVFYTVSSVFASPDIQTSSLVMRWLNISVFVLSLFSLWLLISPQQRRVLYWMWASTVVPLGIFLIASNNPSSWAITGVGTAWFALYAFTQSEGKRKLLLGILYIIQVVIASGARADAALYTIIGSVVVVFLTFAKTKKYFLGLLLPLGAAVISFAFFISSQQSAVATTGLADSSLEVSERSQFGVFAINLVQIPELWVGVFGSWGLGWLDTQMPGLVWVTTAGIFVLLITLASLNVSRKRLFAIAGTIFILYALPLYVLQKGLNHVGEQVQPRYLLPLIIFCAGLVFLSFASDKRIMKPLHFILAISGIAIANSLALYVNTKRYVSGLDNGTGFSLDANIEWWWSIPASPMFVWVIGSLAFAAALVSGYLLSHRQKVIS